jgi:hypothetical protein
MDQRQLLGRTREGGDQRLEGRAVAHELFQALPFHDLAHHVSATRARQASEAHHPRHAEPFEAGQRDCFAHQRSELP